MRNMMKKQNKGRRSVIRKMALGWVAIIAVGIAITVPQTASAVSLKHNSIIENNVITLGDVFSGLEHKADKVLGPAPRPGHDMTLNARTLMRIAIAMDLQWRPASAGEFAVLSRAATVISPTMIQDTLKNELNAQGMNGKFNVVISSGAQEIILPQSETQNVEVESLSFNGSQKYFDAVLVAPSKENPIVREKVSGVIQQMSALPIMRSAVKNGDVISMDDIDFIDVRSEFVKHDVVLEAEDLVGMTARRIIHAGKPIKDNDVQFPQIVKRGELVTMVFKSGPMSLTAQGKALESGAKGDTIRVVNASSSKTLQAKITAQKEVMVQSF